MKQCKWCQKPPRDEGRIAGRYERDTSCQCLSPSWVEETPEQAGASLIGSILGLQGMTEYTEKPDLLALLEHAKAWSPEELEAFAWNSIQRNDPPNRVIAALVGYVVGRDS